MQFLHQALDFQQEPFSLIDNLLDRWAKVVVPIYVENQKSRLSASCLGSSFILIQHEEFYLVTALHVVQDAKNFNYQIGNFSGKAAHLGGLKFITSTDYDLAVAHLSNDWLQQAGIDRLNALTLTKSDECKETDVFLLWGYPGTKNRLSQRSGKIDRQLLSITTERTTTSSVKTSISNAIFISYDHKNVINSDTNKSVPPELKGMSGGPLIRVMNRITPEGFEFSIRCDGVLCEWHRDQRIVVASPIAAVKETICVFSSS